MLSTSFHPLDRALGGGLRGGNIYLVYGEAGSGKTLLSVKVACSASRIGEVFFMDPLGTLHPELLNRVFEYGEGKLENVNVIIPSSFGKQTALLEELVGRGMTALIIDDICALYRAELIKKGAFDLSKELNRQMGLVKQICLKANCPALVTSQVHSRPSGEVEPPSWRVLRHWSDYVIRLARRASVISAWVEKPFKTRVFLNLSEEGP